MRFFGELEDFILRRKRGHPLSVTLLGSPSVKDVVEGLGVPHPEIDVICINKVAAGFASRLAPDDLVEVYPDAPDKENLTGKRLKCLPDPAAGFILDVHLGKLARWMRLLGFDTLYENDYDDHEIVAISAREGRFILTCDIRLLMHGDVRGGRWIRERNPRRQLEEVIGRLSLRNRIATFTRCMLCNAPLVPASREDVRNCIPAGVASLYEIFARCTGCGKIYWEGSHFGGMQALIDLASISR